MSNIWFEGRFTWPFVIAVAYLSMSLVIADFFWRVLVMPFEAMLIYIIIAEILVALLMIGFYRIWRHQFRRN